jgi:hypothetical protein
MDTLSAHSGTWSGTNGFRMMPTDPFHTASATASVTAQAGGNLVTIAYAWDHPEDGTREGFLVLGAGEEPGEILAFWGDSFHQAPAPRTFTGTLTDGVVTLSGFYFGDWEWRMVADFSAPDGLTIRMDNVVPQSALEAYGAEPGAYSAMECTLSRSS